MAKEPIEPSSKEEGPRAFAVFLQEISEGDFHSELSAELQDTMKQLDTLAQAYGKAKGVLTLKFTLSVNNKGVVIVAPEVAVKLPKRMPEASPFYLTQGGNLSKKSQRQQELPLRDVGGGRDMGRDVPGERPATRDV